VSNVLLIFNQYYVIYIADVPTFLAHPPILPCNVHLCPRHFAPQLVRRRMLPRLARSCSIIPQLRVTISIT